MDASGALLQHGFAEGKFVSLGEFDQCLAVQSDPKVTVSGKRINGQYCLIKPVLPIPEKIPVNRNAVANSTVESVNVFLNDEYLEMYLELYKDAMRKTPLRYGVCLPAQCKPEDVEKAINYCK